MTERLYYRDPGLLEFDARITDVGRRGDSYYAVLDRSAFYPTSGGQSYDTGTLNGVAVHDVIESDDGDVWHLTQEQVGEVGTAVRGVVDKERRRRNRQNHTAQHILSAAFHRLYGLRTMSVHLGDEYGAVELQADAITCEQLATIEDEANRIVADNLPVEIMFVDSSLVEALPLRKEPQREGLLRVIRIGDFDYSACGGTHCNTSGGVGVIKIIGVEKIRGRALVKYLAGSLAISDYRMRFGVTDTLTRTLTCHPTDIPDKVAKLTGEISALRKQVADLQRELLPARADSLSKAATNVGRHQLIFERVSDLDASAVSRLAGLAADKISGLAVIFFEGRLSIAAGQSSGLHAGQLARELGTRLSLKGGGNERVAQLGGADITDLEAYRSALRSILENA
ncbi:MAG: DHHA1 domain-containing protein [Candidatus Zixiibacteriota bacterium]